MKRMLALLLSALALISLLAGCGGTKAGTDGSTTLPTTVPTYEPETEPTITVPEGWISFATADADNKVTVNGLSELISALGDTVAVSDKDTVTANLDELEDSGKIASVTVNGSFISVIEVEEVGVRTLYAKGSSVENDPDVIDLTTTTGTTAPGSPATAAPVPTTQKPKAAATTKATTKATTAAKKTTLPPKAATVPTTKKPTVTKDPAADQKAAIEGSNMSQQEKDNAFKLLSYKIDQNGIFYTEHEPWQKKFGFNQIYDLASPLIQLVYGTVRVKFRYDYVYKLYEEGDKKGQVMRDLTGKPIYETDAAGNPIPKDWMIQMWKGRYGMVMLGGEIGVYTKPSTQAAEHYNSAVPEEELVMAMDIYHQNLTTKKTEYLFTRGPASEWWLTGFVPGAFYQESSPQKRSEIIMVGNIQFPNADMMNLFLGGLDRAGFHPGSPSRDNVETYTTSGNSVKFSWQFIDEDN